MIPRTRTKRPSGRNSDRNTVLPAASRLTDRVYNWISNLRNEPELKAQYQASQGLSKYVSSETDPADVRRERAICKWLSAEADNLATEDRLLLTDPGFQILPGVTYDRFIGKVSSVILKIIGDVPPPLASLGGFSGGSSTSRKRTESQPCSKFAGKAHITAAATKWWHTVLIDSKLLWRRGSHGFRRPEIVDGNVMFTVPKNASIDRVAAKEPDLNMFLQKAVGNYIRRQLLREGINLNDQSINQRLAREGSVDGQLATIDLSSASDSITVELCSQVLPPLWHGLLMDLRSPVTRMPNGDVHVNTMMSSMGNGFTFELESLLFYSIARAVAYFEGQRGVISVYGDDIIVPVSIAPDLAFVLGHLGFQVNPDKSFWSGTFRESCGGHYDGGCDISPFYLREPITRLTDAIRMANQLRRWAAIDQSVCDPRCWELWSALATVVPKSLWGGENLSSDTQLVSPGLPRLRLVPVTTDYDPDGSYLYWHSLVAERGSGFGRVPLVTYCESLHGIVTSEPSRDCGSYCVKGVESFEINPSRCPLFPQEILAAGGDAQETGTGQAEA